MGKGERVAVGMRVRVGQLLHGPSTRPPSHASRPARMHVAPHDHDAARRAPLALSGVIHTRAKAA